jgi:hypothetical protein
MEPWARVGLVVLLVVVLFGTFVHYDAAEDEHDPYPAEEQLAQEYDTHVGERALLFGTVQSVADKRLVIRVESDVRPFEMTVPDGSVDVEPGGVVQVYGTLEPERTIRPTQIAVVNRTGGSNLYKYGVSAVGALLVAVLFFRYWTIDTDEWTFEVRTDG